MNCNGTRATAPTSSADLRVINEAVSVLDATSALIGAAHCLLDLVETLAAPGLRGEAVPAATCQYATARCRALRPMLEQYQARCAAHRAALTPRHFGGTA